VSGDAMHAWVECLLPNERWCGFDPTNNLLANDHYIKVHHGRDYGDVPPVRGVYHGPQAHSLDVSGRVLREGRKVTRSEASLRPLKLDEVKIALGEIGVTGMSVMDVRGCGKQGGHRESFRGADYIIDLPMKVKIEIVARDEDVEEIVSTIEQVARTGQT